MYWLLISPNNMVYACLNLIVCRSMRLIRFIRSCLASIIFKPNTRFELVWELQKWFAKGLGKSLDINILIITETSPYKSNPRFAPNI